MHDSLSRNKIHSPKTTRVCYMIFLPNIFVLVWFFPKKSVISMIPLLIPWDCLKYLDDATDMCWNCIRPKENCGTRPWRRCWEEMMSRQNDHWKVSRDSATHTRTYVLYYIFVYIYIYVYTFVLGELQDVTKFTNLYRFPWNKGDTVPFITF